VPGWSNVSPYPTYPDLSRARRLAAGNLRDGKVTLRYRSSGTINPAQAQIVKQDLRNIGFRDEDIMMVGISGSGPPDPDPMRNTDVGVNLGWCSSYPDPYDFFDNLLYGGNANKPYSANYPKMNIPKWDRRMEAAARLVGPERYKAYGQLDLDIMRQVAPIAVERTYNNRFFFSERVNPKSLVYQGIYMDFSLPAMALK
jgi:ABC-type transport system substrate-binding protein